MKILVGVPAYNEAVVIGSVLAKIPRTISGVGPVRLFVVDDGSTDQTTSIARRYTPLVVRHVINRGLGGALKTILTYAERQGYDILVTLDADGQHRPEDIRRLVEAMVSKKADVVIGVRMFRFGHHMNARYLMNMMANLLTALLFGVSTRDSQSGFRVFNRRAIETIHIKSDGMEVSSEIFREIEQHRLAYREVSIPAIYSSYSLSKGQRLSNAYQVVTQMVLRLFQ